MHHSRVKRRAIDHDGNHLRTDTNNTITDTRLYKVEYLDISVETFAANIISYNILSQVYEEVHSQFMLDKIIDQRFGQALLDRRPRKNHSPDDACRRVKEPKAIAGEAVSYAPPPTPKPSTASRTGRGGTQAHVGTLGLTKSVIRADGG